jgi:hypothetical protein
MGTRADFYIKDKNGMRWLGSLFKDGHPWNIDLEILIQINPVMFEELVRTFLVMKVDSERYKWPWPWQDSQMTDYSYIFDEEKGKVVAYSMREKILFDPIKIVQGEDLNAAEIPGAPDFPKMGVEYG